MTKHIKRSIKINSCKTDFIFGGCAKIAICSAFNINQYTFKLVCNFLKIRNPDSGLNFWECKKVINALHKAYCILTDNYIPNDAKITYKQLAILFPKGKYIAVFDTHLSYMENGEVFDSYFDENDLNKIPTGWWRIVT